MAFSKVCQAHTHYAHTMKGATSSRELGHRTKKPSTPMSSSTTVTTATTATTRSSKTIGSNEKKSTRHLQGRPRPGNNEAGGAHNVNTSDHRNYNSLSSSVGRGGRGEEVSSDGHRKAMDAIHTLSRYLRESGQTRNLENGNDRNINRNRCDSNTRNEEKSTQKKAIRSRERKIQFLVEAGVEKNANKKRAGTWSSQGKRTSSEFSGHTSQIDRRKKQFRAEAGAKTSVETGRNSHRSRADTKRPHRKSISSAFHAVPAGMERPRRKRISPEFHAVPSHSDTQPPRQVCVQAIQMPWQAYAEGKIHGNDGVNEAGFTSAKDLNRARRHTTSGDIVSHSSRSDNSGSHREVKINKAVSALLDAECSSGGDTTTCSARSRSPSNSNGASDTTKKRHNKVELNTHVKRPKSAGYNSSSNTTACDTRSSRYSSSTSSNSNISSDAKKSPHNVEINENVMKLLNTGCSSSITTTASTTRSRNSSHKINISGDTNGHLHKVETSKKQNVLAIVPYPRALQHREARAARERAITFADLNRGPPKQSKAITLLMEIEINDDIVKLLNAVTLNK